MPNPKRSEPPTLSSQYASLFNRSFQGLAHAIKGGQDTPQISGFTLTRRPGDWLCVVRAFALTEGRSVVAFGAGETMFEALRNVSISIAKGQWRVDKFAVPK